jgi:hypothetical protein
MYHLNIEIKEIDQQIKLIYLSGQLDETLKEQIKQYKKGILKRLEENEAAKKEGFLVYNHGLMYEYRYGLGAFIFIERHSNGLVSVWRENYLPDQNKPFKTKIMVENVSIKKGFENAQGFINWLKKRR